MYINKLPYLNLITSIKIKIKRYRTIIIEYYYIVKKYFQPILSLEIL